MFPKAYRFTAQNFEFLRKKMGAFRAGGFLFLYRKGSPSRFAVVVRKKTELLAVKRNKFRRQTYAFLRKDYAEALDGFQLICLYKADKLPKNNAEIQKAITALVVHLDSKK